MGLGAAAISVVNILVLVSTLGLDAAIVRFLPHTPDQRKTLDTVMIVVSSAAFVSSAVFMIGLDSWASALLPLQYDRAFVLGLPLATISATLLAVFGGVFLAREQTRLVLVQSTIFGATKLAAVRALTGVNGASTLVGAWAIGAAAAAATAGWLTRGRRGTELPFGVRAPIDGVKRFALANYAGTLVGAAPMYLLSLVIANRVGPEANAYFYIATSINGLLVMIPAAAGLSLFASGSRDYQSIPHLVGGSMRLAFGMLLPALVAIWLLGGWLLLVFGRGYSEEGTRLLWVLALSNLPLTLNILFFNIRRIQQRMRDVLLAMGWILGMTMVLSLVLLPRFGIIGAGFAWLISQGSAAAIILFRHGLVPDSELSHTR